MAEQETEAIVVGAGPAGLSAAIYLARYNRSMFWCITCDGYSSRGKSLLVVGHTNGAAGEAMQLSRLSDKITLLTNSHVNEIDAKHQNRLSNANIPVVHDKIERAEGNDGMFD